MKFRRQSLWLAASLALVGVAGLGLYQFQDQVPGATDWLLRIRGKATVDDRLQSIGPRVRPIWQKALAKHGVPYPPPQLTLVGLKRERQLLVYAADNHGRKNLIKSYPVLAASGGPGPKLSLGDGQVPEGRYAVQSLNPNSAYHLALRLDYPNDFDLAMAEREGRTDPGHNIMIHGSSLSIGCLAMGDAAIEEIFVLAADTGLKNIEVLLCPYDFRRRHAVPAQPHPVWLPKLYQDLKSKLQALPLT